jgi:CubicO group peptidase (beta-lactamase class C family)
MRQITLLLLAMTKTVVPVVAVTNLGDELPLGSNYNRNQGYCELLNDVFLKHPIIGYVVLKNGYLVAEYYTEGNAASKLYDSYSVTHGLTDILFGKLIEQGLLGLQSPLGQIFNHTGDWSGVVNAIDKQTVTIQELLAMKSGFKDIPELKFQQDSLTQVLNAVEYSAERRGKFEYAGDTNVMAHVVHRVTGGITPKEYADRVGIFTALDLVDEVDFSWRMIGAVEAAYTGFSTSLRNLAKIGQLLLQNGQSSNNNQLLQSSWVQDSTVNHLKKGDKTNHPFFLGYGFHWWTDLMNSESIPGIPDNFEGAYANVGKFGQYVAVFPSTKAVVVIMSDEDGNIDAALLLQSIAQKLQNMDVPASVCSSVSWLSRIIQFLQTAFFALVGFIRNLLEVWLLGLI